MAVAATMKLTGDKALIRTLDRLGKRVPMKVVKPAVNTALKPTEKAARRNVPKRSGTLRKAIGRAIRPPSKKSFYRRKGIITGVVGVRYGFDTTVDGRPHSPTKIAHLVEGGAKEHTILPKNKKALSFGGVTVASVEHFGFKGANFLKKAWDTTRGAGGRLLISGVRSRLAKEVAKAKR